MRASCSSTTFRCDAIWPSCRGFPRFSIWCGTRATERWLTRYPIEAVVYGHLHLRSSRTIDNVRHEEVSLGYPKQWNVERGLKSYLREIL